MKLRRILPLFVLGIACLLVMSMNGKQSALPSAVCDGIPSASIIHTAQDEQDAALLLIRQTQVGNPSEGVHAARQHEIGGSQTGARQQIRRLHRLGNQFMAIQLDEQHKQAHVKFLTHLTHQFAEGHYLYARGQMRC